MQSPVQLLDNRFEQAISNVTPLAEISHASDVLSIFETLPEEYKQKGETIICLGDSMEIMKGMKSDSVDLIFADPPYNIGKEYEQVIPRNQYVGWCKKWIDECMRLLNPEGTFYFMAATQFMPYLDCYVDSKYHVITRIVWYYDSSGVQAKKRFGSLYEPILMVTKSDQDYIFNSDEVLVETRTGAVRQLIDYRKTPPQPYSPTKVLGNVWYIPRVRFKMSEYENHPTQKPEKLLEIIVRASSKKGQIVLDPFAGAFTTCAVAQALGRRTIGIEMREEYYKIGLRRLGITTEFNGEQLRKVKVRKTNHKSKKDHLRASSPTLNSTL